MINIDITVVYQIIAFFVLLIVLNKLLYRPVQNLLKEREERIDGSLKKAEETEQEITEGLADYEKRLKEAAVKGHEVRNKLRGEGLAREKELIEAARADAAKELGAMRSDLENSKKSAVSALREEAAAIGKEIAEKVLERKVVAMLLTFGLAMLPAIAMASTEGGHGGGGTVWKLINFALLVIGVVLAWVKGIKPMLEKRGTDIRQAIDDAQRAKDEADRKALEYREKLSLLENKIQEIQNELKLEGEAERERIIKDAEEAAVRLREQAKLTAAQEVKKAKDELRREAASLAVEMARDILGRELTPDDQNRLVKGYIDNLRLN